MFDRLNRTLRSALDPDKIVEARKPTIESLQPGDVVSVWDVADCIVESVLACSEEINGRVVAWRWNLMDEGRMLETAPDGNVLYTHAMVFHQDSPEFETLVADPEQGGVLKAFEARVQAGTAARNPVLFEQGGRTYRVISTGTFAVQLVGSGTTPVLPRAEVWRDVNPARRDENVYFELEPTVEAEDAAQGSIVLGIWTTHIALLFGRPLTGADIQSIYPAAAPEGRGDRA
jgi:hypothetical protein